VPDLILRGAASIFGRETGSGDNAVAITNGVIESVKPFSDIDSASCRVVDVQGCTILPGFVDAHTHLVFAGTRENELLMRAKGTPYLDILRQGGGIYNTVNAVRQASEEELEKQALYFLDQALAFGITTVEAKSGYGLDVENEEKMLRVIQKVNTLHPVDVVPTFLVHSVPKEYERAEYITLVEKEMLPRFRQYARWFDIFLEKGVFSTDEAERLISAATDLGYVSGIHTNQVHDMGGIALAQRMGVRHVNHLEVLSDKDAEIIKQSGMYAVFLPTAEGLVFSSHVGQIHKLLDMPDRIVLSSDFNPGSSPVLNPFFVMTYALMRYRIADPHLLVNAYTANPAAMLNLTDRGSIEPGMQADLVCLNIDSIEKLPYFGTFDLVSNVIKKGVVYSRESLKQTD